MEGLVGWMETVLSWLRMGITITLAAWILVVLPMLMFPKSRPIAAIILLYSSYYMGIACCWYSFVVAYKTLGGVWLAVGLLAFGVGVVPLAVFGAAMHGMWAVFWDLILGVTFACGPRALSVFIMYRHGEKGETHAHAA